MQSFLSAFTDISRDVLLALLVVLGLGTSALAEPELAQPPAELTTPEAGVYYSVVKVVDGDTITISVGGAKQTVRLIGINTPETVDPRKPVECFGKEASDTAKKLLSGRQVRVEFDTTQGTHDKYHRLLAYVYRDDDLFVNKHMVEQGYAYEYTYRVPYEYQKQFKQAQKDAEFYDRGLWAPGVCEK